LLILEEALAMVRLQAVIFDLGGTLVSTPAGDEEAKRSWELSYQALSARYPGAGWPDCEAYVRAMSEAENAHWQRVRHEQRSSSPEDLLGDGFRRLGCQVEEEELLAALDGYAQAAAEWAATPFPDAHEVLRALRQEGYRLGLLSNTWWAAAWHNAHLATHRLDDLLDVTVYTSDLPYSKPHPSTFLEVVTRLGVEPEACVMVGDMMIDDISGALGLGMRAVWKYNERWPRPAPIVPTATITHLKDLPSLLRQWQEELSQ
jgi:putative hydrolase of the HAD superfamily